MISYINGTITETKPDGFTIEAAGIGYDIKTTPATASLQSEGPKKILIRQITKETGSELFGFETPGERELFDLLTNNVSGVGPKTALNILAGTTVENFKSAVVDGNVEALSRCKGTGRKTAERIILELKEKIKIAEVWRAQSVSTDPTVENAILALMSLGHAKSTAEKAVVTARKNHPEADQSALIREALRQ